MALDNAEQDTEEGTDGGYSRRGALRGIAALGAGLSAVPAVGSASPPGRDVVPKGQARKVARERVRTAARREEFAAWRSASVGPAVTYHLKNAGRGPEYVPSAYVFSVTDGSEAVGYVTVAARRDWPPVVEYSRADPPRVGRGRARRAAERAGGEPSGRVLYRGGVQYGMELDDGRVVNLRNGRVTPNEQAADPRGVAAGERLTRDRWAKLEGAGVGPTSGVGLGGSGGVRAAVASSGSSDRLWWVPAWTEHDPGNADTTSVGPGADTWDRWDGCVPVAASMVIAYHEYVYEWEDEKREAMIDRLHWDFNTSDDGYTYWWDVDDGFNRYDEGRNDFDGRNIYLWTHPNFTISEISDNSRPFLLNMTSGDQAEDRSQNYGDHSVCVVGYRDGGDELALHDTWDDEVHYLTWGSWLAAMYTKVTTS